MAAESREALHRPVSMVDALERKSSESDRSHRSKIDEQSDDQKEQIEVSKKDSASQKVEPPAEAEEV